MTESPEPTPDIEPRPEPDDVDESTLDDRTRAKLQKARNEAKSLRTRLHAAEEQLRERDEQIGAAAAREAARDRAEVERIAAEHLIEASDIWRAQPDLTAFYDGEFNEITRDRVVETAMALAREKPHLGKANTAAPPSQRPIESLRPGAAPQDKPKAASWSTVIRG